MAFFETIGEAVAFVWALPFGVGKLMSIGAGGYVVSLVGHAFKKKDNK
jgi:hypothetical protein